VKTFLTRILSGLIYIVLVIGSLLIGPVAFGSVLFVFLILGLFEIHDISMRSGHFPQKSTFIIIGILIYLLNILIIWDYLPVEYLVLNFGFLLLPFIVELFRKVKEPVVNI